MLVRLGLLQNFCHCWHNDQSAFFDRICFSQPYVDMLRVLVYVPHQRDLEIFLRIILLVYTDSVDLEKSAVILAAQLLQYCV